MSHYDVQFEHGIVENVSVEDMDILTMEAHGEHVEHEGETIAEMGGMMGAVKKAVVKKKLLDLLTNLLKQKQQEWVSVGVTYS